MGSRSNRLIVLDPSFKDVRAAGFEITEALVEKAVENGYETVVYAGKSFDSRQRVAGAMVRSIFSEPSDASDRLKDKKGIVHLVKALWKARIRGWFPLWLLRLLKRIRSKLENLLSRTRLPVTLIPSLRSRNAGDELRDALCLDDVDDHDHIVVHTSDAFMYRTILQFFLKIYPNAGSPHFHLSTPYNLATMPVSGEGLPVKRVVSYLQQMGCINRSVFLYAEDKTAAESLSSGCHVDVVDLGTEGKRESADESYYSDIADRLLINIGEIVDSDNVSSGAERLTGRSEIGGVCQGDVHAESGYNAGLIEAVESEDGHVLYIKQIMK